METKETKSPLAVEAKYIVRKTNEEIEVIAFNCEDEGARSETDWVTYIDSKGEEHIKEKLHIKLDFKMSAELPSYFKSLFDKPSFSLPKYPSTNNTKFYELAKELYVNKNYVMSDAILEAKVFIEKTKDVFEDGQEENNTKTC